MNLSGNPFMGLIGISGGSLGNVMGKQLRDVAANQISVEFATCVSSSVAPNLTLVTFDSDPTQSIVRGTSIIGRIPTDSRVVCLAYPPRGLLIVGILTEIGSPGIIALTSVGLGQLFTAAQVPVGARALRIMCQAAGGGGGGSTTSGANEFSPGAGGAGGHYAESIYPIEAFTFPCTYNIGAPGTAGASGGGSGGTGGTTNFSVKLATFIPQVAGSGGDGGSGAGNGTGGAASTGGSSSGGTLIGQKTIRGTAGHNGLRVATTPAFGTSGAGGSSALGAGGREPIGNVSSSNAGANGTSYGGGGSGAKSQNAAGAAGGAGGQGAIFIEPIF